MIQPSGGAEVAAYYILREIAKSKEIQSISILTNSPINYIRKSYKKGTLKKIYSKKKINYFSVRLINPRIPIISDYFDARRFKSAVKTIIQKKNISLLHIHTYSGFYLTPDASWKIPILYSFHDFPSQWPKKPVNFFPFNYIEKLWRFIAKKYWQLILSKKNSSTYSLYFHCLSSDIMNYLIRRGVSRNEIQLLANGYTKFAIQPNMKIFKYLENRIRESFNSFNERTLKLMVIGQLNNIKNQYTIIKAFERSLNDFPNSILLIAGRPTPGVGNFYIRKIWKSIKPKAKKRIFWFGHISNKHLLMNIYMFTDLVISMSYSEAGPLILGECKNIKKPILSSDVGALKDLLPKELRPLDPYSPQSLQIELKEISRNRQKIQDYTEMMKSVTILPWSEIGKRIIKFYQIIKESKESKG